MRVLSIVGARPQFVKVAAMCHALIPSGVSATHRIIHTGQHYDAQMSDGFFSDLNIPDPDYNLNVGSGKHGEQTGEMLKRLEPILEREDPEWILLYGDTNSTLAGALVAAKLHQKTGHIEAGLRSFNRYMPEEINRIVADQLSDILFCPTEAAMGNLAREGLRERAVMTGDVMYDAALHYTEAAKRRKQPGAVTRPEKTFALATVHRAENTDNPDRLLNILRALERIASTVMPVVLPLHPRTRKMCNEIHWEAASVQVVEPLGYLDMLLLENSATMILTDSGGVQKEAYFFQVPCITLREETEWIETLENGCNRIAGAEERAIIEAAHDSSHAGPWTAAYGTGKAGEAIWQALSK